MHKVKVILSCVAGAVLVMASHAPAAALLQVQILTSTTGSNYTPATYSSPNVLSLTGSGQLYYEVVVESAPAATSNSHTSKTPSGTADQLSNLPTFSYSLSSGATFGDATLSSTFANGGTVAQGPNGGTTGAGSDAAALNSNMNVLTITGTSSSYIGDDSELVVASGTLTLGNSTTASGAYVGTPAASGSFRFATSGIATTANSASEDSTDPYIEYAIAAAGGTGAPEPGSMVLLGVGGIALLRRRRTALRLVI